VASLFMRPLLWRLQWGHFREVSSKGLFSGASSEVSSEGLFRRAHRGRRGADKGRNGHCVEPERRQRAASESRRGRETTSGRTVEGPLQRTCSDDLFRGLVQSNTVYGPTRTSAEEDRVQGARKEGTRIRATEGPTRAAEEGV